jgi:hypothetical protein
MRYLDNKTPYKMVRYPDQGYAYSYCKSNHLILGGIYYLSEYNDNFIFLMIDDKSVGIGRTFFKEYFKIDLRTINLEKILK